MKKTVALHTLGCKLNFSETSTIGRLLENDGFEKKDFDEVADVYVINTCSVTDNADKECRQLVHDNAQRFCDLVNSQPLAPVNKDFILQLFSIPIRTKDPVALKNVLFNEYKIEVPVMPHGDQVFLRYSIQAFNTQAHLDTLYNAVEDIIRTTDLIQVD